MQHTIYQHAEFSDDARIILRVPGELEEQAERLAKELGQYCECDVDLDVRSDVECDIWTEGDAEREQIISDKLTEYCAGAGWNEVFQQL